MFFFSYLSCQISHHTATHPIRFMLFSLIPIIPDITSYRNISYLSCHLSYLSCQISHHTATYHIYHATYHTYHARYHIIPQHIISYHTALVPTSSFGDARRAYRQRIRCRTASIRCRLLCVSPTSRGTQVGISSGGYFAVASRAYSPHVRIFFNTCTRYEGTNYYQVYITPHGCSTDACIIAHRLITPHFPPTLCRRHAC